MRLLFLILLVGTTSIAFSQIVTDRPTQSFSPHVMPKGGLQLETGFLSERPNRNVQYYNLTYLNALVRYGVTKDIELRIVQNYLGQGASGAYINGMSPTTIGTKIHVHEQIDGLPQIGFLASYTFTNGDEQFAGEDPTTDLRVLFQNDLSDKVTLAYNFGGVWSGDNGGIGVYTVMIGIAASDQLGFFLEPYGSFAKNSPTDNRFNAGLTYLVSDNFQVDFSAGNGLTRKAPDSFISFGASVLF